MTPRTKFWLDAAAVCASKAAQCNYPSSARQWLLLACMCQRWATTKPAPMTTADVQRLWPKLN